MTAAADTSAKSRFLVWERVNWGAIWAAVAALVAVAGVFLAALAILVPAMERLGDRIDAHGAHLSARIDAQSAELSARIDAQGAELSARIDAQGAELRAELRAVRADLAELGERIARLEAAGAPTSAGTSQP